MSYTKWGLTKSDATSADHDKGIVAAPDGSFYQINDFKRQKNDGLDTDKGAAFKSGLYEAAKAADSTYDPSNFNTATDVENALKALGNKKKEAQFSTLDRGEMEMSPEYAEAKARVDQRVEDVTSGRYTDELFNPAADPGEFLERYKLRLGERLANGNYLAKKDSAPKKAEPNE